MHCSGAAHQVGKPSWVSCSCAGKRGAAIEAYQAALGLNSQNAEAAKALEALAQSSRPGSALGSRLESREPSDNEEDPIVAEDADLAMAAP